MLDIFEEIVNIKKSERTAALCTVTSTSGSTPRKEGSKMIVFTDGSIIGTVGGGSIEKEVIDQALECIKVKKNCSYDFNLREDLGMICGGKMSVFIEVVNPSLKLYLFGAGHIGRAISKYAIDFGFDITLIDNREEIFKQEFPSYCKIVCKDYTEAIDTLKFDNNTYIVILTHKHLFDADVLEKTCKKEYAYLGMIGSKPKIAETKMNFISKGILTSEEFDKIDSPIGLKFAAETPEEIAISILAKLIDTKNKLKQ